MAIAEILVNHVPVIGERDSERRPESTPLQVVYAWVSAVNAQDIPEVVARSARDIVLGGPRGTARGTRELRDWVERAGLQMTTERVFAADTRVVLLQQAVWRDPRGLTIGEATIATRFEVTGNRVGRVMRYDSLPEALSAAGLSEADEHPPADGRS